MDAQALVDLYRLKVDPDSDPLPQERACVLKFTHKYLDLKEGAGGFRDEAWPLFLDTARNGGDRNLAALTEDRLTSLWDEVWAELGVADLPDGLSPQAQLVWLGTETATGADDDDPAQRIKDALCILWPRITGDEVRAALDEAAERLDRDARRVKDMLAELMLRSGGDMTARLFELRDGGPRDPEPDLRKKYPEDGRG